MASRFPVIASLSLLAALAFAAPASAVVVHSTPAGGDDYNSSANAGLVYFQIKYDGVRTQAQTGTDFSVGLQVESGVNTVVSLWNTTVSIYTRSVSSTSGANMATNFAAGEMIDLSDFIYRSGNSAYLSYTGGVNDGFALNTSGYLGLKFNDTSVDNKAHYGWARITRTSTGFILNEWAYETVGERAILAGALTSIPEPATAALWMAAAAGVLVTTGRRRGSRNRR
ncbi:hypothetical protein [Rariglobus hedericola]|uniref:PEP-CTERM sorting domain-containing protein n=1 Tax=Rariglobus hedericola TaxID=2597822 RepID=A0A556QK60_9BACT|nr:hypothetical protein [Rariglobus hedericola]TSJ77011.1 hypothetical protein FPL22_12945 [Rariglobus hedericola]